jgi:hypothetical protein
MSDLLALSFVVVIAAIVGWAITVSDDGDST